MVDDVEDHIAALLQRTLELLGDEAIPRGVRVVFDPHASVERP
ncbi:hypothetical protein O4220_27605 [Rhodococcus ruber]|uniref:Uncharacterized protein n=1 Tax=Rhodococcus ruber TaxID=1830 RepID=A0ABT4MQJ3_9NOCA|nr:hypothetical protein [Rhodococcus ruber]MCZ4522305.1 hypothetical protein [Rhodococcus ruber]